jgi:cell division protein ZapE
MFDAQVMSLTSVTPDVTSADLLSQLVPPREFAKSSFSNYLPDTRFDSQAAASSLCELFANKPDKFLKTEKAPNLYLDGGFGVGKTHLLAAIFHASKGRKAFGSFLAFTGLMGALGFSTTVDYLRGYDLICIDEFELDDPGDTMLLSRMLSELDASGVRFAATSNTPPNALGQGRFAADDFAREISGMAKRFRIASIEGEDYRHRDVTSESPVMTPVELVEWANLKAKAKQRVFGDSFDEILTHLATLHPTKYSALVSEIDALAVDAVHQLHDQVAALRWVAFVDRLYEAQISVANSGEPITKVFNDEMVGGTYRKKYLRAISRLGALTTNSG